MKVWIGLDFGKNGAVAALNEDGSIHSYIKMPEKMFDLYSYLYENFDEFDIDVQVTGEALHAIYGSAANATFSFGKSIGRAIGVIECLQMPYQEVKARDWQEHIFTLLEVPEMGEVKTTRSGKLKYKRSTKDMASFAADILWPELDTKHDGIIDALLIAEFARLTHKQARLQHKLTEQLA